MKEEIALKEKIIRAGVGHPRRQTDRDRRQIHDLDDLKDEMKAIKLFLGREYPDFKSKFPGLLKKVCS